MNSRSVFAHELCVQQYNKVISVWQCLDEYVYHNYAVATCARLLHSAPSLIPIPYALSKSVQYTEMFVIVKPMSTRNHDIVHSWLTRCLVY